ncbi:MAG: hypothetical protein RB292_02005 [Patescibacteria group bacterium]|nr:hypothetical protein [Patescibacteria group bacterium]
MKKKSFLPIVAGLIVASLDLAFWIWFVAYGLLHSRPGIFEEGLLGMVIFHMPASILLPTLGLSSDSIIPQTVFLFVVGLGQYFIFGYILGRIILFFKKKFKKI